MAKVIIVDYQLGNLFSVRQALLNIGLETEISSDPHVVAGGDALILPGVGAFGDAMNSLNKLDLVKPMRDVVDAGKPFMGICLGLQLLFTESEEFGSSKGLDLIPGTVRRFANVDRDGNTVRVPQIAWNSIHPARDWKGTPLQGLAGDDYMYFVHSFFVQPEAKSVQLADTQYYNTTYTSAILENNIFACQFHPEKSAEKGLLIYKTWATLNKLL